MKRGSLNTHEEDVPVIMVTDVLLFLNLAKIG